MSNENRARLAHELLDELDARAELSQEQEKLLRSFLPELPKQKTLEELAARVYDAWMRTSGYEWAGNIDTPDISLEKWLAELHAQLKGLEDAPAAVPAKPTHPEFLETLEDYENAPAGTVVAKGGLLAWLKQSDGDWVCDRGVNSGHMMALGEPRRVLRWGWG